MEVDDEGSSSSSSNKIKQDDGKATADAVQQEQQGNNTTATQVDPSEGFERSKDAVAAAVVDEEKEPISTATTVSAAAGGFMREADIAEEGQRQQQQQQQQQQLGEVEKKEKEDIANKLEKSSEVARDASQQQPDLLSPNPAAASSSTSNNASARTTTTTTTPKANKNSLNLAISPALSNSSPDNPSSDATLQGSSSRLTRSSPDERKTLQIPRSDPPPTPPTRLASSTIKRRSSRSPNNNGSLHASSSPFSSSNALQNALSSPSAAAAATSSSPSTSSLKAEPSSSSPPSISSSSMKRSPSSPLGSPNASTSTTTTTTSTTKDVFSSAGSSTSAAAAVAAFGHKRRKSSSPSRSPPQPASTSSSSPLSSAATGGASPPPPLGLHINNLNPNTSASQGSPLSKNASADNSSSLKASTSASTSPQTSTSSSSPPPSDSSDPASPTGRSNNTNNENSPSSPAVVYSALAPPIVSGSPNDRPNNTYGARMATPRRVKVYALHESNWIDLGTGSCTYYRGVSRKRFPTRGPANKYPTQHSSDEPPPSPPATMQELSITGRALRDALQHSKDSEEIIDLVDLDDDFPLDEDQEHVGWIEVVKEGRWKSDMKPAKARQRTEGEGGKNTEESKHGEGGESLSGTDKQGEEAADGSNDDDEDYDRIWTTRIEKPDPVGAGYDRDSFMPVPGGEDGEEVIGRYRRQQDTLIVWKSASSDTELALSFAATAGCLEVWQFLENMHTLWECTMDHLFIEDGEGELEESQDVHGIAVPHEVPTNGLGLGLGRFSQQIGLLEEPSIGNLAEIERAIKAIGRTPLGREKLSTFVGRTGFIPKLIPVFKEAEDLESLQDLHMLCILMHDILNLNDHGLWELVLNEDIFYDVISILEYDPDFPTMKAAYRAHLSDPALFVEVVPIAEPSIKQKIHQTYRLQYIKDVIMPRALDDTAFQIINGIVYFNQVDIVQYLTGRAAFWKELFDGAFPESKVNGASDEPKEHLTNGTLKQDRVQQTQQKQEETIAFLQSYAQMVKQLQPSLRTQTYRALADRGMLRVIGLALSTPRIYEVQHIRVAIVEILMLLVDSDPSSIRSFILKEHEKPGPKFQSTLMSGIIYAFHREEELGIKSQLAEAIRVLLLPPGEAAATETASARTRPDDPNADKFLQFFYEYGVAELVKPLVSGDVLDSKSHTIELSIPQIALFTHLCELLCFFVAQHSFRSKFFILSSRVTVKVAALLRARPKHVRLVALRFFRACIGRNDDFYNRFLVKNNALPPIIELTRQESPNDNLLSSACLELFEYLRLNTGSKIILNELMTKHEADVKSLVSILPVLQGLVLKWEQLAERQAVPAKAPSSEADTVPDSDNNRPDPLSTALHRDDRALTAEEEDYFNTDDDEDEASQTTNATNGTASAESTIPAKRSDTAEEVVDDSDLDRRKRQKIGSPISNAGSPLLSVADKGERTMETSSSDGDSPAAELSQPETDPETELARIREKRKRAEDEEDDEDFLTAKKLSQDSQKEKNKVGLAGIKNKNVSGKLKLFFGKKAS